MSIGERIKQRRLELGLTVDQVAERLGKNRATVYRYESNEIENFPTSIIEPLSKVLLTTPASLMGWDELEPVLSQNDYSSDEKILIDTFRALSPENKDKVCRYADGLLNSQEGDEVLRQIAAQREKQA